MASKTSTWLFFTVLLLCYTLTCSSRTLLEPQHHQGQGDVEEAEDKCEGLGVGAEECLMRRTLAAHLDYIYTQNHHNRP